MKFSIIPRYPTWGASSRLRAWTLGRSLVSLGHSVSFTLDSSADVLLIQKMVSSDWMRNAEGFAGKVVYDFDDREVYASLPEWEHIADLLLTDTEGHAGESGVKCSVLPDPIDFCPSSPLPWVPDGKGVVWFGHHLNYGAAEDALRFAHQLGQGVRVISGPDVRASLPDYAEFVQFDQATISDELRHSSFVILSHDKGDPYKSNNKMICAITHGLPCIVSQTPEYMRLEMALKGLPFKAQQEYVWANYHPTRIAQEFLKLLEAL